MLVPYRACGGRGLIDDCITASAEVTIKGLTAITHATIPTSTNQVLNLKRRKRRQVRQDRSGIVGLSDRWKEQPHDDE